MSWLVSSIGTAIANSLNLDSDDDDDDNSDSTTTNPSDQSPTSTTGKPPNPNSDGTKQTDSSSADQTAQPRGVKEDLSELSQTLTRQLWGVASFLAPPPQISDRDPNSDDPDRITAIRNDLSEIGGKFRTGISKLSGNIAASEFTKIASNLLQIGVGENLTIEEYAQRGVVGVTEEVVAFARDVVLHPETWLDFPLPDEADDDGEEEDFDLSDAQQEHVLAVECLVPELAALRSDICLGYMSEASFWKIYFVLVHPRLSEHDALVLSTPEIVKARAMLSQELCSNGKSMPYEPRCTNVSVDTAQLSHEEQMCVPLTDKSEAVPVEISSVKPTSDDDLEIDKHPVTCTVIPVVEKSVINEVSTNQTNTEQVSTKQENTGQVPTKPINVEEIPTNRTNIDAKLTNMEGVPTMQTTTEQVSTKLTNMDIAPIMQTNIAELPTKQALSTSKSVNPKDEYDADDWLKEENAETVSFKGNSYPLGKDDENDISFSDLEED